MKAILIQFKDGDFTDVKTLEERNLKEIQKRALSHAAYQCGRDYFDPYLINDYLIGVKKKTNTKWNNNSLFRIITEELFKSRK